jgi:hypothetical protein
MRKADEVGDEGSISSCFVTTINNHSYDFNGKEAIPKGWLYY